MKQSQNSEDTSKESGPGLKCTKFKLTINWIQDLVNQGYIISKPRQEGDLWIYTMKLKENK